MDSSFECAYCYESNSIFADPSGGERQCYVEDCQVCCRPNVLNLQWNDAQESFEVTADPES